MSASAGTSPFVVSFRHLYRVLVAGVMLALAVMTASTQPAAAAARPRCRIGLVLSGGGALGIAHVGVLEQPVGLRMIRLQRWENGPYLADFSLHTAGMRVEIDKIWPRSPTVSLSNT